MRITTWNVNSVRSRMDRIAIWLEANAPDVLCMQETKVTNDKFPVSKFKELGYHVTIHGQSSYNGVAIASKTPMTDVQIGLPIPVDPEARGISATVNGFKIINVYVPNGQAVGSEKYLYKLKWLDALTHWVERVYDPGTRLVLTGDFNIAPEDRDVYDPGLLAGEILCTSEERSHFQHLLDIGFSDALRLTTEADKLYTFWDYRGGAFRLNQGFRIDHILVSESIKDRIGEVRMFRDDRRSLAKLPKPSDHIPVSVDIN